MTTAQRKEETYNREVLAMIELMQAADFAKATVITYKSTAYEMKVVLRRAIKASGLFLRKFRKHSTDEADNELESVGSILYEIALAYTSIPESAIDDFSKDLALLVNEYNKKNNE